MSNLFVLGASAFPQNPGYNPTRTVGALAYWAAAAIRDPISEEARAIGRCVRTATRPFCRGVIASAIVGFAALLAAESDTQDFTQIERGRYLAIAARLRELPHGARALRLRRRSSN